MIGTGLLKRLRELSSLHEVRLKQPMISLSGETQPEKQQHLNPEMINKEKRHSLSHYTEENKTKGKVSYHLKQF